MTEVLQCPYCELRFSTRSELEQHKAFDHPGREQEPRATVEPSAVQREERVEEPKRPAAKPGFIRRLFKGS